MWCEINPQSKLDDKRVTEKPRNNEGTSVVEKASRRRERQTGQRMKEEKGNKFARYISSGGGKQKVLTPEKLRTNTGV